MAAVPPMCYLDFNATTPLHPAAASAITSHLCTFGNPSSPHALGRAAASALSSARSAVAALVGAPSPSCVVFESCATESINRVFHAFAQRGAHIITASTEHAAVLACAKWAAQRGCDVTILPVGVDGRVEPSVVAGAVRLNTHLVTVMLANNETGAMSDIAAIASAARAAHVRVCGSDSSDSGGLQRLFIHTDASQAVGKVPVSITALGVDALTLAGHKLGAPKGIGATVTSGRGFQLPPLLCGGGQEGGSRAGTENVLFAIALGAACDAAAARLASGSVARDAALRWRLASALAQHAAKAGLRSSVNGPLATRYAMLEAAAMGAANVVEEEGGGCGVCLPNTLSIAFSGTRGHAVAALLGSTVAVSAGAACHSEGTHGGGGGAPPSHVLAAMGVPLDAACGTLRLSLGWTTTAEEVDTAAAAIVAAAAASLTGGVNHVGDTPPLAAASPSLVGDTPLAAVQKSGSGDEPQGDSSTSPHPPTERLYLLDTYRLACEDAGPVSLLVPQGGGVGAGGAPSFPPVAGPHLLLSCSKTVAHPQGGGQPGDRGIIILRDMGDDDAAPPKAALAFVTARMSNDVIAHYAYALGDVATIEAARDAQATANAIIGSGTDALPPAPSGALDAAAASALAATLAPSIAARTLHASVYVCEAWRLTCAKLHSAGHLLDAAVQRALVSLRASGVTLPPLLGGKGSHAPIPPPTNEYEGVIPPAVAPAFLTAVNAAVQQLLTEGAATRTLLAPCVAAFTGDVEGWAARSGIAVESVTGVDVTSFPPTKPVRLVAVGSANNVCPCAGTHVGNVEELRGLVALKVKGARGATKIYYAVT